MSSSSSASSSSPSSASTPEHGGADVPGPSRRRTGDFDAPSSSRQRAMNEVLPEPFLEALATQVAIDAAHSDGRLAVASALATIFQVCSTWREVSRSDLLWRRLTRRIWRRIHRLRPTWRQEFMYWHQTARNFATGRHSYAIPHFDPSDPGGGDHHQILLCRCLAVTDQHLACGFTDGTVRLFDLETRAHVSTFRSNHGPRIGPFSRSVCGIVITNSMITFARLDGDIYVAIINGPNPPSRRAHSGDVVNNGVLVEFAGCDRWWVGLFAGLPGRAFQIWDANTEQLVFFGGSLTDPETVMGWHMLAELTEPVGRLRVTEREMAVACTSSRLICFNLSNPEVLLRDVGSRAGFIVASLDVNQEALFVVVELNGVGTVRRLNTFERVSRFQLRGGRVRGLMGCINLGYALTYSGAGGAIRVWDIESPQARLCRILEERVDEGCCMVANDRHVAISCNDASIHLLDFGVQ